MTRTCVRCVRLLPTTTKSTICDDCLKRGLDKRVRPLRGHLRSDRYSKRPWIGGRCDDDSFDAVIRAYEETHQ